MINLEGTGLERERQDAKHMVAVGLESIYSAGGILSIVSSIVDDSSSEAYTRSPLQSLRVLQRVARCSLPDRPVNEEEPHQNNILLLQYLNDEKMVSSTTTIVVAYLHASSPCSRATTASGDKSTISNMAEGGTRRETSTQLGRVCSIRPGLEWCRPLRVKN